MIEPTPAPAVDQLQYASGETAGLGIDLLRWERWQRRILCAITIATVVASAIALPKLLQALAILLAGIPTVMFVVCVFGIRRAYAGSRGWIRAMTSVLCFVTLVLTLRFDLPLRISFALASPWLNSAADRIVAGGRLNTPAMIGPFLIRSGELRQGCACLWVDTDPSGPRGFVRHPVSKRYLFNISIDTDLSLRWQYTEED